MVGYIALNDASTLLRLPDGAQGVRLKLDDIFAALKVANDICEPVAKQLLCIQLDLYAWQFVQCDQMEKDFSRFIIGADYCGGRI